MWLLFCSIEYFEETYNEKAYWKIWEFTLVRERKTEEHRFIKESSLSVMHYGGDFRMDASKQDLIGQWGEVSIKLAEPVWMRLLAFHKLLYQLPQRLKEDRDDNRWRGSDAEVRIQGLWRWKPWKIRLRPSESCWWGLDNPDGQYLWHSSATSVDV